MICAHCKRELGVSVVADISGIDVADNGRTAISLEKSVAVQQVSIAHPLPVCPGWRRELSSLLKVKQGGRKARSRRTT